jgi:hypothetical protein
MTNKATDERCAHGVWKGDHCYKCAEVSATAEIERLRAIIAKDRERLLMIYEVLTGQHRSTWPDAVESGT